MDAASLNNSPTSSVDAQTQKYLQPKKILVVEDDKNMTVLLGRALLGAASDVEIQWATSLEQAFTHLIQNTDINQKIPYDLIIADIFLEGKGTGLDLFKVISHTHPNVPFLVISSLPSEHVEEALQGQKKDNVTYLKKPFLFSDCKRTIQQILTTSGAGRGPID